MLLSNTVELKFTDDVSITYIHDIMWAYIIYVYIYYAYNVHNTVICIIFDMKYEQTFSEQFITQIMVSNKY